MTTQKLSTVMFTPTFKMVGVLIAGTILFFMATTIMPGLAPWVKESIEQKTDGKLFSQWTEKRRKEHPVKYLKFAENKLTEQGKKLSEVTRSLRAESIKVERMVQEYATELGKTNAYLQEGKALYHRVESSGDLPITFAGRTYPSLKVFKAQLEVLFRERAAKEAQQGALASTQRKLSERLLSLMVQSAKVNLARDLVAPQLALAEAGEVMHSLDGTIDNTLSIIDDTEKLISNENLVGTTNELLKTDPAMNGTGKDSGSDAFERFLADKQST